MSDLSVLGPSVFVDFRTGVLQGDPLSESVCTVGQLRGVFADESSRTGMDRDTVVYRVQCLKPVAEGTSGGLFYGTSFISSGTVGDEYFMTRGHFHSKRNTGEFYWGIEGEGLLLLMNEDRSYKVEKVVSGSLHYIPGLTAHRLINTGPTTLAVGACWMSDSGHDYQQICDEGFPVRVLTGPRIVEAGS